MVQLPWAGLRLISGMSGSVSTKPYVTAGCISCLVLRHRRSIATQHDHLVRLRQSEGRHGVLPFLQGEFLCSVAL